MVRPVKILVFEPHAEVRALLGHVVERIGHEPVYPAGRRGLPHFLRTWPEHVVPLAPHGIANPVLQAHALGIEEGEGRQEHEEHKGMALVVSGQRRGLLGQPLRGPLDHPRERQ